VAVSVVAENYPRRECGSMTYRQGFGNHLAFSSVVVFVIVQTPDHSKGKHVGLVFGIRPKNIMTHLMVNGVNPFSL
jgi:hypothetical protein